jgi:hypothetical protein
MGERCTYVYASGNRCIYNTANVHADLEHDYQPSGRQAVFDTLPPVNPAATMGTVTLDDLNRQGEVTPPSRDVSYIVGVAICYGLGVAITFFAGIAVGSQMGW